MNDDGDWWVPVEGHLFKQARHEVITCLTYEIPDDGTLVYKGKERVEVCDIHTADEIPFCCDMQCYQKLLAYHFIENRKW